MDARYRAPFLLARNSPVAAIQNFNSHLPADFKLHDALTTAFKEHNSYWEHGWVGVQKSTNDFYTPI